MTLRCWCKRYEHTKVRNIWYLMPGLSLNDGLILLTADDEGDRMFLDTCRMYKVVDVYLDHGEPVNPLFTEGPKEACHRLGINEKGQRLGERRGVVGEIFTQGSGVFNAAQFNEGREAGTSRQAGKEDSSEDGDYVYCEADEESSESESMVDSSDLYDSADGDGDDNNDEDFALSGDGDAESDSESVVDSEEVVQSVTNPPDQGDNKDGERHEERWEETGYLTDDNDEELYFIMREKQRIEAEIRGAGGFNNDGGGPNLEGSGAGDMEGNVGNLIEGDNDVNATDEGGINVQASDQGGDKEVLVRFESDEQGSYPSSSGESGCDSTGRTKSKTIWFNEKDKNLHFQEWMVFVDKKQFKTALRKHSNVERKDIKIVKAPVVVPTGRQRGGGRGRGKGRGRGRGHAQGQLPPTSLTVGTPSTEQPQLPPSNVDFNGTDDQLDDEALAGIPDEVLTGMGTSEFITQGTNSNVVDSTQTNTEAISASANVGLNTESKMVAKLQQLKMVSKLQQLKGVKNKGTWYRQGHLLKKLQGR
ncbi:hypothetical protein Tsubulata_020418 [Turnera subulata]|uniref:Uncharacterized protein n=1 Tax=Turnera subulata TaxID=218843 RepID=A0A9Q0FH60_9ROSI|nr:hypothetical protein Tsubulata_020418 [Turnera subulata]